MSERLSCCGEAIAGVVRDPEDSGVVVEQSAVQAAVELLRRLARGIALRRASEEDEQRQREDPDDNAEERGSTYRGPDFKSTHRE